MRTPTTAIEPAPQVTAQRLLWSGAAETPMGVVGRDVSVPAAGSSWIPCGSEPVEIDHVYGVWPPTAVNPP